MRLLTFALASVVSVGASASKEEVECLAQNIYHEARGQGVDGRFAVAHVTINRMHHKRFPDTVCAVVKQGRTKPSWKDGSPIPIKNMCQFSWYCDGKADDILEPKAYLAAKIAAYRVYHNRVSGFELNSKWNDSVQGAMWYHATQVKPYWITDMQKVDRIDNHIFYIAGN
jgi:spore germination cell wall hydrolase CwlJ-like protein